MNSIKDARSIAVLNQRSLAVLVLISTAIFSLPTSFVSAQQTQDQHAKDSTTHSQWKIRVLHSYGESNRAHSDTIKNVLLLADGKRALTCGVDGTACLWDIESQQIIRRFAHPDCSAVYCMAVVNKETQLLTGGNGATLLLWNLETGQLVRKYNQEARVYSISVFDDQQTFLVGDNQGHIVHYEIDSEEAIKDYRDSSDDITALTILPDQDGFVSGNGDGEVAIWKRGADQPTLKLGGLSNWTCCLVFSDFGQQLFGTDYSGNVALWDTETWTPTWIKKSMASDICWARFLNDDQLLAVDTEDAFYLIDRATGDSTSKSITIPAAAGFDISADRKVLWTGGTNLLCGWNIDTGERIFPDEDMMQFANGLQAVEFHNDRIYQLTGRSEHEFVRVIQASTGKELGHIQFREMTEFSWDSPQIITLDCGLAICGKGGFVVVDYDSGSLVHNRRIKNSGFVRSPRGNHLSYSIPSGFGVDEIDVTTNSVTELLCCSESGLASIKNHVHLDEFTIAVDGYSEFEKIQIWSWRDNQLLSSSKMDEDRSLADAGDGLVIGLNDSQINLFTSPGQKLAAIDGKPLEQLIADLEDASYQVRSEASKMLVAYGDSLQKHFDSLHDLPLETRVQLKSIKQQISVAKIPVLDRKPLKQDPDSESVGLDLKSGVVCADPKGRYVLLAIPDSWKSELLVCDVGQSSWSIVNRLPLRSRASQVNAVHGRNNMFVIGYADGNTDVIEIVAE